MLKLKNIKRNNGVISADYLPEGSKDSGMISIEEKSGDILESVSSSMDSTFPIYLNHAIDALKKLRNKEELPEEKTVMWY